ncbi:hypothetical protein [Pandoraea soli]|uniref:Uncharacterized protein n=1 Tax=Pandoraea soli TaxID=2508293 RepID=A0ABY6VMV7_9BURK|nr:hypothetical protein [Pandoraea soli]VVD66755.1 hypothetical protein PSO31014_00386 [Pandoraea soli]
MLTGSLIAMLIIVLVVGAAVAWLVDRNWCREHPGARHTWRRHSRGIRHG